MTITYFYYHLCLPDCYSMRFNTLSNYHLIDWLIGAMFVCLLELILGFCYSNFGMGNQWIWTRINYHPCITSEPTNQVCNIVPRILRQHWTRFFPVWCCLEPQGQYCIGYLPVQCCPRSIKTTLNRIFPVQCCLDSRGHYCTRCLLNKPN